MKWKKVAENEVLEGDGFYISWLSNTRTFMGFESRLFAGDDGGKGETALVQVGGDCLILNGDFRKEYEEAVPNGYEACRAVYEANRHHVSPWSEDEPAEKLATGIIKRILDVESD